MSTIERVSRPYAASLVEFARNRPEVYCLSADLTNSVEIDHFKATFPDRFISCGLSEQSMMSVAGGLAREGLLPFVHTFAVFVTRRPYDQIAMSIAYPNLRVHLMGFLPGLTTPGGVTHQAIDDVALMRILPNMTVVDCGDATEVETVLEATADVDGPVYCRILRGSVPRLFREPLELGRARVLEVGNDICLISAGICTGEAMPAVAALRAKGVSLGHVHVSTIKPFTDKALLEAVGAARRGVITLENHLVTGGLGSSVAELMAEQAIGTRLIRMGLRDTYAHGGSLPYLLDFYGLAARHVVSTVEQLTGEHFGIELTPVSGDERGPVAERAEAL
jgi:transketolase